MRTVHLECCTLFRYLGLDREDGPFFVAAFRVLCGLHAIMFFRCIAWSTSGLQINVVLQYSVPRDLPKLHRVVMSSCSLSPRGSQSKHRALHWAPKSIDSALRVQVPNNHIPKYLIIGYLDPLGYLHGALR